VWTTPSAESGTAVQIALGARVSPVQRRRVEVDYDIFEQCAANPRRTRRSRTTRRLDFRLKTGSKAMDAELRAERQR
jgi:hypothetical protein